MHKRIALLYDFDYTLSDGFMQSFGLMQDLGFDDVYKFFATNDAIVEDPDMDKCLSSLGGLLLMAKEQGKKILLPVDGVQIKDFPNPIDLTFVYH